MPSYTAPDERSCSTCCTTCLKISEAIIPAMTNSTAISRRPFWKKPGKISANVSGPLNMVGDTEGCRLENGVVYTPDRFQGRVGRDEGKRLDGSSTVPRSSAARACPSDEHRDGRAVLFRQHGLPDVCGPVAWRGLGDHGRHARTRKPIFRRSIPANGTGTMNLTEPHCGTDLGLMRTKAEPQADGSYKHHGSEDLHLGRRKRHRGQHRPSRAGEDSRWPGRVSRASALHRAEIPGERGWQPGCAQRRLLRQDRGEDGHPRQRHLRDEL
jgi:hypothetical protein